MNAVGESRTSVRTVAWAYNAPAAPTAVTARPVVTPTGEGGIVALTIAGIDRGQTGAIEITSPGGETARIPVRPGQQQVDLPSYRVGANVSSPITVVPFSRFELPAGLGGTQAGNAVTVWTNGIGAPRDPVLTLSSEAAGDGTSTVTARGAAALNGDGSAPALRHRARRRDAARRRPTAPPPPSPGSPTARSTASRCASTPGTTDRPSAARRRRRACGPCRAARRRRAGPSPSTDGRMSPTVAPSGSSARSRCRPSASRTATTSSSRGGRRACSTATRRSRSATSTTGGRPRHRGRPWCPRPAARRTSCRRRGGWSPARAAARWWLAGRPRTPPQGKAAVELLERASWSTTTRTTRCSRTRPAPGTSRAAPSASRASASPRAGAHRAGVSPTRPAR